MKNSKILGIVIVLALIAALSFVIVSARPKTATGAMTQSVAQSGMSSEGFSSQAEMMAAHHPEQAQQMSSEGFSSYEEMMAAHHPAGGSGSDSPGCGGVDGSGQNPYAGQTSEYGLSYDDAGYQKLLGDAKSINLDSAQTKLIVGLNIELPCCGVKTLQASGNCECGHHQAMFGLAKRLASNGYDREQIQSELNKWKQVFYPAGAGGSTGGC